MSSGFSGADVEHLDILASRFESQAARVREIIVASSALLFVTEWTGGKVDRIRSDWNSSARPSLTALAETLQRSANTLKREADQQRQASGLYRSGGMASSGDDIDRLRSALLADPGLSTSDVELLISRLRQATGDVLLGVDVTGTILDILKDIDLPTLDRWLPAVGLVLGAVDFAERTSERDYFGAFMTFLSSSVSGAYWVGQLGLVKGAAGTAVAGLGPLALGISALGTFIDWTLPSTPERQDETFQKGAEHLFGEGVDTTQLSTEQADRLSERYAGPLGVAYMISDTMDATADRIFPWNW